MKDDEEWVNWQHDLHKPLQSVKENSQPLGSDKETFQVADETSKVADETSEGADETSQAS